MSVFFAAFVNLAVGVLPIEAGMVKTVVYRLGTEGYHTDRGDRDNILIYSCPGDARQRRELTIMASYDEGRTWTWKIVLHPGAVAYSDLVN